MPNVNSGHFRHWGYGRFSFLLGISLEYVTIPVYLMFSRKTFI